MEYSKITIARNVKLVEFAISNFYPFMTNRVIKIGLEVNTRIKYPDEIMVSFQKRSQYFGVYWVTEIWYICIRYVDKVFSTFINIVN